MNSSRKKILIVSGSLHSIPPTPNSPAVPRNIFRYAEKLQNYYDVVVISFDKGEIESKHTNSTNARYIRIPNNRKYQIIKNLIKLIPYSLRKKYFGKASEKFITYYILAKRIARDENPDFVLSTMHIDIVPFLHSACPKAKHFFFFRSSNLEVEGLNKLLRVARKLHGFISLTQEAENYVKSFIIPHTPLKTYVIPNFIDENIFNIKNRLVLRHEARKYFGISETDFVIGYAGRLSNGKGLNSLFNIINQVYHSNHNIKLLIAGDKKIESTPDINLKIDNNNPLQSNIIIYSGWIPYNEMPKFYSSLDVCILLSQGREGHSMFALEGMASGVPVIATNVGGNAEIIVNNVTGYLISEHDNNYSISNAILNLIKDSNLLEKFSMNAHTHTTHHFNFDYSFNKLLYVFNDQSL